MAGISDFLFGTDPQILTKTVEDPIKTAVSRPLSSFLSQRIGKGLPKFDGPLTADLDPQSQSRYQEFISLDAPTFFEEKVAGPATKRFKEDFLPELRESFAGGLRGSGRIGSELQAINKFSSDLAEAQGQFEIALPKEQFALASTRKAQYDADFAVAYNAWTRTLPEFNPVLEQSLKFLGVPSGFDTITALDPGKEGFISEAAKIIIAASMA